MTKIDSRISSIGGLTPKTPFILAPMAGVTDSPFRSICSKEGCSLVYSEMISAKGLYFGDKATEKLLFIHEDEAPVAFQIFGSEPDVMAFAAERLASRKNAILDINMGCPVPKVVKNGDGSALLKNPALIGDIVKAVVKAAGKPVTVKIRIGWDSSSINAVETAKIIEDAGASAVAVHGRTRDQYYTGKADWDMIAKVKGSIRIPVIGNGDVFTAEDALAMMSYTGCDFVMIARGSYGNPWIFREAASLWQGLAAPEVPDLNEKLNAIISHFELHCKVKGEHIAVKEMRKHIGWYFKGIPGAAQIRRKTNTISSADDLLSLLENTRNR